MPGGNSSHRYASNFHPMPWLPKPGDTVDYHRPIALGGGMFTGTVIKQYGCRFSIKTMDHGDVKAQIKYLKPHREPV